MRYVAGYSCYNAVGAREWLSMPGRHSNLPEPGDIVETENVGVLRNSVANQ